MSISELYESGTQKNNITHFAAIANIAIIDGEINESEKNLLSKFANKLNIGEEQYREIMKNPGKYPINPPSTKAERLEYLYDLFKMIFADHEIDEPEMKLIQGQVENLGTTIEIHRFV